MSGKYILDGKTPVPADFITWAKWFETADRHVAKTYVGPHLVSTVFLGIDHQFGDGRPLLFETMVFKNGSATVVYEDRCSTWDEAEQMHEKACNYVRNRLPI